MPKTPKKTSRVKVKDLQQKAKGLTAKQKKNVKGGARSNTIGGALGNNTVGGGLR